MDAQERLEGDTSWIRMPTGLQPSERKYYIRVIQACHQFKGRQVYLKEIMRLAGCNHRILSSIAVSLRLSGDYDSLCELRSALGLVEIEHEAVDKAISRMENSGYIQPRPLEPVEKIADFDLGGPAKKLEYEVETPKMILSKVPTETTNTVPATPVTKPFTATEPRASIWNDRQALCLLLVEQIVHLDDKEIDEIIDTAKRLKKLGAK